MGSHVVNYTTRWGSNNAVKSTVHRAWSGQKAPYSAPMLLTYSRYVIDIYEDSSITNGVKGEATDSVPVVDSKTRTLAVNACYANFKESAIATAQNANNLLEAAGSFGVIAKHAATLLKSYKQVKSGNISGALRTLGATLPQKKIKKIIKRSQQASDIWLELHFGWVPLVQDIGTSIAAIQRIDLGKKRIRSSNSGNFSLPFRSTTGNSNTGSTTYGNQGEGTLTVKMGGVIEVSNPNALLANQLGFVNPLSVAWEAVPFSFVVDWFSNVGQVLSSCSDFVGVNLTKAYTTTFTSASRTTMGEFHSNGQTTSTFVYRWSSVTCNRILGIEGPSLAVKPFKGFSPIRGATAISLLVQHLKS